MKEGIKNRGRGEKEKEKRVNEDGKTKEGQRTLSIKKKLKEEERGKNLMMIFSKIRTRNKEYYYKALVYVLYLGCCQDNSFDKKKTSVL